MADDIDLDAERSLQRNCKKWLTGQIQVRDVKGSLKGLLLLQIHIGRLVLGRICPDTVRPT